MDGVPADRVRTEPTLSGPRPYRPPRLYRYARWRVARAQRYLGSADTFLRPVLTLVSGAAAAQAIIFAARPVLTRLYTPDEFGVLTVFVTLVAIFATVGSGRYEDALMLPDEDREAANVLALALLVVAGIALLVSLSLVWLPTWESLLGGEALRPALLLLPPALLLMGWHTILETWHTRGDRFRAVAVARSAQSLVAVGLQLAAGLFAVGALGLVGGATAGFAIAALWLSVVWVQRDGLRLWSHVRFGMLPRVMKRYARFPLYSAPAALLNVLASRAPVLLLAAFFATDTVGQFGVAFGTLVLPLGLIAGAIGQVFFVRAAEAHRTGDLGGLTLAFYRRLLVVTVYPALVVLVAGPRLFTFVFGSAWEVAGQYAQALAVWVFLVSVAVPLTRVFDVTERQRADLGFSVLLFAVQTGAFIIASVNGDALYAVLVLGVVGAALRLLHIGWMLHLAGASLVRAASDLLWVVATTLPFLAIVVLAQMVSESGAVVLGIAVLSGLGYLAFAAWRGALREPASS